MKVKMLLLFFSCCLLGLLSGCDINVNPYTLTADGITGIWLETQPTQSDSPKYTNDPETINGIVDYINGLKLRLRIARDEDVAGMAERIEISYADGTVREFWHIGNNYFLEADGENQYVMEYDQAQSFDENFYNKMQTAPLVKGIVEQVFDSDSERKSFLVNVDSATQSLVGDKTSVSVLPDKIFNDYQPGAEVSVGDTVEFYVDGGVNETYPTQCGAWKMNVLQKATASIGTTGEPTAELPVENSNPYFVLFSQLFADDTGLNGDIQYIAVDLANVVAEDNTDFLALMNAFCEREGYTLLEDSVQGLIDKGVIKDLYFEDGIVVAFTDTSFSETKLVTEASKWRSGLGAIGGEYTLENKDGVWSITEVGSQWIS